MKLWLVGRFRDGSDEMEMCGVFSSEELALAQCTTPLHWMGPAELDQPMPEEKVDWPGFRYPVPIAGPEQ